MAKRPHGHRSQDHRARNGGGAAAQAIAKVRAPFRFAPVGRWVHEPEWGKFVSHDHPFADGVSGSIQLEITAKSPLLVGGARRKSKDGREAEVFPFQLPDGSWAIPGSSLQGCIRSIVEVAAFGRLGGFVDQRRFGLREIGPGTTSKALYLSRFNTASMGGRRIEPNVRAGWLIATATGHQIVPCGMSRIHIDEVWKFAGARGATAWPMTERTDAKQRLDWLTGGRVERLNGKFTFDPEKWHPHQNGNIEIRYSRCVPAREGSPGTIVLTGKSQPGVQQGRKKWEFVFHSPAREAALTDQRQRVAIDDATWADFLHIHEAEPGRAESPAWAFWKERYRAGEPVPVFYLLEEGSVASLGLAYLFKAAHRQSSHDLLENSDPAQSTTGNDLASVIFGANVDVTAGIRLKRRATFDAAIAEMSRPPERSRQTVLLGPKPSFYPIYVRQPGENGALPRVAGRPAPFASYTPITRTDQYEQLDQLGDEHRRPELAGSKIWPAWRDDMVEAINLPEPPPPKPGEEPNREVQTRLQSLPPGTLFKTTLRFHNLRPVELGALLWALSFGDDDPLKQQAPRKRHRLGMGKPFGFGSVAMRVTSADIFANDLTSLKSAMSEAMGNEALDLVAIRKTFEHHMDREYRAEGAKREGWTAHGWSDCKQIVALRTAATPAPEHETTYMELGSGPQPAADTYRGAKIQGAFLPVYPGGELPRRRRRNAGVAGEPEPDVGRRVRLAAGGLEGVIQGPAKAAGEWLIQIDGRSKSTTYKRHLFTVLE